MERAGDAAGGVKEDVTGFFLFFSPGYIFRLPRWFLGAKKNEIEADWDDNGLK